MQDVIDTILSAKKSMGFFGERQLLERGKPLTEKDLSTTEQKYNFSFPADIRQYLLALGSGNVNEFYIPHTHMIHPLDNQSGKISGFVVFSSDSEGNYFTFDPKQESSPIYFCSYEPLGYCACADNIEDLLTKFIANNYDIRAITQKLKLEPLI